MENDTNYSEVFFVMNWGPYRKGETHRLRRMTASVAVVAGFAVYTWMRG